MTERHSMTRLGTNRDAGRAAREHPGWPALGWPAVILRVAGSGLLIATAAIHLDLYLTGYRTIPTIGWLFLLQVIAAFGLGLAVLAIPRRLAGGVPARLAAAAGAGFALATLAGYLLSVWTGLFGFTEVRTGAGIAAGLVEIAAFVVLAALALAPAPAEAAADGAAAAPAGFPARIPPAAARVAGITAAGLAVAALVLFGLVLAGASSPPPAATSTGTGTGTGAGLKTATIGGITVLTNAKGFTLYSFAPDTPAASKCYGSCAVYWPPVTGTAAASPGVPGRVGTITRTGGSEQLTYNGHPLYTYIGDSAPGQARGNNLNLNGGLWHDVPASR
jgi:predicted lipoprotein with Yx(FWY)xxD motif